jgi:predicted TIM-barrel fold metal-dependent hydrolase
MGHIDAHVHVWTDDLATYPICDEYTPADMQPPSFTADELLAHAYACGVDRIVLIQMSFYGFDNAYMLETIARRPETFRGVAIVDHRRGGLGEEMARLHAAGVRGFRVYQLARGGGAPLDTPEYEELCRRAGEMGMAVCALADPSLLPAVGRAARRYPQTTFVIDHLGRVGAGGRTDEGHVADLCALAACGNCLVKVSAFYALGLARPPHEDLVPLVRRVRDAFGADRLMWATDCPYQVQSESYADSLAVITEGLPFLSEGERHAMLEGTAARVFFGA